MTEHDPLCPHDTHPFPATCDTCALIARVRADERAKRKPPIVLNMAAEIDRRSDEEANLRATVMALHAKAEVFGLSERAFAYEVVLKLMNRGRDD